MADYPAILEQIHTEITPLLGKGRTAGYIPILAEQDPSDFGMTVKLLDGTGVLHRQLSEIFF